jgi:small subunit ribosomal protein S19e
LTTPHAVPASKFIERLARYLKENVEEVHPPAWVVSAKTSSHVEKPPQDSGWWYTRAASVLRKVYLHGPIGLEKLRAAYGGRTGYRVKPEHVKKAGGGNIRKILQQLEAAGLVQTVKPRGRQVSPKGRKLLNEVAEDLYRELVKVTPELKKYQVE